MKRLAEATAFAVQRPQETWECEPFEAGPERPMLEMEAGSNLWFQGDILQVSETEVQVRFPGERERGGREGGREEGGMAPLLLCNTVGVAHGASSLVLTEGGRRRLVCACPAASKKAPAKREWINRRSSRIWRGSLSFK